jgi:hypothetical protein
LFDEFHKHYDQTYITKELETTFISSENTRSCWSTVKLRNKTAIKKTMSMCDKNQIPKCTALTPTLIWSVDVPGPRVVARSAVTSLNTFSISSPNLAITSECLGCGFGSPETTI